jgi:hypothetical protein
MGLNGTHSVSPGSKISLFSLYILYVGNFSIFVVYFILSLTCGSQLGFWFQMPMILQFLGFYAFSYLMIIMKV